MQKKWVENYNCIFNSEVIEFNKFKTYDIKIYFKNNIIVK